ncbi:MAG: ATP-binding protein [Microcella sp.]
MASRRPPLTLIDGRSGAGKTTIGRALADRDGATLLSLDDVYPGWDGLEAAEHHVLTHVIRPLATGAPARYRRWDWQRASPAEWVDVDVNRPLVIEGCGAIGPEARRLAARALWVELADDERRRRAIERDGELFAAQWERWARQEEWHALLHRPRELADEVLSGSSGR